MVISLWTCTTSAIPVTICCNINLAGSLTAAVNKSPGFFSTSNSAKTTTTTSTTKSTRSSYSWMTLKTTASSLCCRQSNTVQCSPYPLPLGQFTRNERQPATRLAKTAVAKRRRRRQSTMNSKVCLRAILLKCQQTAAATRPQQQQQTYRLRSCGTPRRGSSRRLLRCPSARFPRCFIPQRVDCHLIPPETALISRRLTTIEELACSEATPQLPTTLLPTCSQATCPTRVAGCLPRPLPTPGLFLAPALCRNNTWTLSTAATTMTTF